MKKIQILPKQVLAARKELHEKEPDRKLFDEYVEWKQTGIKISLEQEKEITEGYKRYMRANGLGNVLFGRPPKYKEKTKVMRVPEGLIESFQNQIKEYLNTKK